MLFSLSLRNEGYFSEGVLPTLLQCHGSNLDAVRFSHSVLSGTVQCLMSIVLCQKVPEGRDSDKEGSGIPFVLGTGTHKEMLAMDSYSPVACSSNPPVCQNGHNWGNQG